MSFEEALLCDVRWTGREADGRVFSGWKVEAVRLGRINEAGGT